MCSYAFLDSGTQSGGSVDPSGRDTAHQRSRVHELHDVRLKFTKERKRRQRTDGERASTRRIRATSASVWTRSPPRQRRPQLPQPGRRHRPAAAAGRPADGSEAAAARAAPASPGRVYPAPTAAPRRWPNSTAAVRRPRTPVGRVTAAEAAVPEGSWCRSRRTAGRG